MVIVVTIIVVMFHFIVSAARKISTKKRHIEIEERKRNHTAETKQKQWNEMQKK